MLIIIITLNINFWLKYLTPIDKLYKPAPTPSTNRSRYFRTQRDRAYIDIDIKAIALLLPQINMDGKTRDRVYYCSFTVGWGRVYQDYLWVTELSA